MFLVCWQKMWVYLKKKSVTPSIEISTERIYLNAVCISSQQNIPQNCSTDPSFLKVPPIAPTSSSANSPK